MATALGALLTVAAVTMIGRGFAVWQRADSRLQQLFLIEKGLDMLGQELRNGVVLADVPFEGTADHVSFAAAVDANRVSVLRYGLQPERRAPGGASASSQPAGALQNLVRETRTFPLKEDEAPALKTIIPGIRAFSIRYAAIEESEQGQKSILWSDVWTAPADQANRVPKLVRLRFDAEDSRGNVQSVTRDYRIPHGTFGSPDAEAE